MLRKTMMISIATGLLAACGSNSDSGGADEEKKKESFRKQFVAQCSLEYRGSGIDEAKKTELCNCASDTLYAQIDTSGDGSATPAIKLNKDTIIPALKECEAKVGVSIISAQ